MAVLIGCACRVLFRIVPGSEQVTNLMREPADIRSAGAAHRDVTFRIHVSSMNVGAAAVVGRTCGDGNDVWAVPCVRGRIEETHVVQFIPKTITLVPGAVTVSAFARTSAVLSQTSLTVVAEARPDPGVTIRIIGQIKQPLEVGIDIWPPCLQVGSVAKVDIDILGEKGRQIPLEDIGSEQL